MDEDDDKPLPTRRGHCAGGVQRAVGVLHVARISVYVLPKDCGVDPHSLQEARRYRVALQVFEGGVDATPFVAGVGPHPVAVRKLAGQYLVARAGPQTGMFAHEPWTHFRPWLAILAAMCGVIFALCM